jgi:hypothetical protein
MSAPVPSNDTETLTEKCENVTEFHAKDWLVFFRKVIPILRIIQNTSTHSVRRIICFNNVRNKRIKSVNFDLRK